jgi:hypothetical protein
MRCGSGLLGRPASESDRLRHGDRGQGPGDRRQTALMSTIPRRMRGFLSLITRLRLLPRLTDQNTALDLWVRLAAVLVLLGPCPLDRA